MQFRWLPRCLIVLVGVVAGCQTLQRNRPMPILVRDAEPSALATASTLDSCASRPYSISRTVLEFGTPASFATAYQVNPFASRAARI
jgi:hypothetical protein